MSWLDDDQWEIVDYSQHPIRPWCLEERCWYCRDLATHKIEETTGPVNIHPFTAYVCCVHFFGACTYEELV